MRHDKIIHVEDMALNRDAPPPEDMAKGPPVAQQHFCYCGRAPRKPLPNGRCL